MFAHAHGVVEGEEEGGSQVGFSDAGEQES